MKPKVFGLFAEYKEPAPDIPVVEAHDLDQDWFGILCVFSSPMFGRVINVPVQRNDKYRIYAPFLYNDPNGYPSPSSATDDGGKFWLPCGASSKVELPRNLAFKVDVKEGFAEHEDQVNYDAIRVDFCSQFHSPMYEISRLLELIRQYSCQWWVAQRYAPVQVEQLLWFDVLPDCRPAPIKKIGSEYFSSWKTLCQAKERSGLEVVFNTRVWSAVVDDFMNDRRPDPAIIQALKAVSSYFSYEPEAFILQACIALEMMERSSRQKAGRGKSDLKKYSLDLLKGSVLWRGEEADSLRALFKDRDHVAHGNVAPSSQAESNLEVLERHFELLKNVTIRYRDANLNLLSVSPEYFPWAR